MFFKKYKLYKENLQKDYELVKQYYRELREAEDKFREMTICNNKVFIIRTDNENEFTRKYNEFISEISEGVEKGESALNMANATLGAIFIKSKDKIEFKENNFIVKIEYKEIELKKKYTMEDYLSMKSSLEKLEENFEDTEYSFNRKYSKPFYSRYMDEVSWSYYLNRY